MNIEIYLDNNATTRCLESVISTVQKALGKEYGNPASTHERGYKRREELGAARAFIEDIFRAPPGAAVFTSGGTEANNLVLLGEFAAAKNLNKSPLRLITSRVEHSSVTNVAAKLALEGVTVEYLPNGPNGVICLDALKSLLKVSTTLVSLQWANSETGVLQPIEEVANICRETYTPLHCDAAQAVGKIKINLSETPITYLTFTGHKIHAPPGVGVVLDPNRRLTQPVFHGGDQERGIRPGTQNLPAILGLKKALEIRYAHFDADFLHIKNLRDAFEQRLIKQVVGARVNGCHSSRVCNTSNIYFPRIEGAALVAQLGHEGILCSQTSACTSHLPRPSPALLAMGLSEAEAFSSVRFSFSVLNKYEELDMIMAYLPRLYEKLKLFSSSSLNPLL